VAVDRSLAAAEGSLAVVDPPLTAVVELAECCGLLTIDHLAPREAHTLGFGLAIRAALECGAERLLLAVGGSASTDGGLGLLVGLGLRVAVSGVEEIVLHMRAQDVEDPHLPPESAAMVSASASAALPPLGNAALPGIVQVDWSRVLPAPTGGAVILSDVTNPLLGPDGAAAVFGPQKGGASLVEEMDANLAHWAGVLGGSGGRPHGAANASASPAAVDPGALVAGRGAATGNPAALGAGAAGGAGFALQRWGATSTSGARAVADAVGLREAMLDADLVITGEGSFDDQTASGKVVDVVRQLAVEVGEERRRELPVAVVAGRLAAPFDGPAVALWDLAGERALTQAPEVARQAGREFAMRFSDEPQI
ncbi:MAG: glycerate kinase, partial [Propionibacteriaceae bacterium]|nr:glycerate kinase [Propionibacteriaceae bacterium]